jgi:hypothetical protein
MAVHQVAPKQRARPKPAAENRRFGNDTIGATLGAGRAKGRGRARARGRGRGQRIPELDDMSGLSALGSDAERLELGRSSASSDGGP